MREKNDNTSELSTIFDSIEPVEEIGRFTVETIKPKDKFEPVVSKSLLDGVEISSDYLGRADECKNILNNYYNLMHYIDMKWDDNNDKKMGNIVSLFSITLNKDTLEIRKDMLGDNFDFAEEMLMLATASKIIHEMRNTNSELFFNRLLGIIKEYENKRIELKELVENL